MTFTKEQTELLKQPINAANVEQREGGFGKPVDYVEGWHVIDEANRIFGFDGWSCETVETVCVNAEPRDVTYTAKVRVTIGNVVREGTGAGSSNQQNFGKNHENAIKEAETDARKRALMTFGNQFGLCLYDRKKKWKNSKKDRSAEPVENILVLAKNAIKKATDRKKLDEIAERINQRYDENQISRKDYNSILDLLNNKYEEVSS